MKRCVAEQLDGIQCHMLGILLDIRRESSESVAEVSKRRNHAGRMAARHIGFWSQVWVSRVLTWHDHVVRSGAYGSVLHDLLRFHDQNWLVSNRLNYVPDHGDVHGRLRPDAGRLGTRLAASRPQARWEEGVALAKQVDVRQHEQNSSFIRKIGSRIQKAKAIIQEFFMNPQHDIPPEPSDDIY